MGLFGGLKEIRKDKKGNTYEYDLRTGAIKKQNPGSTAKFRIGSADSTKEFEARVKSGKHNG